MQPPLWLLWGWAIGPMTVTPELGSARFASDGSTE